MDKFQKEQLLEEYATNDMAKLRKISYPLFIKFGGISDQDHDNFYSKANEELWKATETFDESKGIPFEPYLRGCLDRKFKTEMTMLNRVKRKIDRLSISIDLPVGDDESTTIGDLIASDFSIEDKLSDEFGLSSDDKIEKYLEKLSKVQRKIVRLLSDGYSQDDIRELLHISKKEYSNNMLTIRAYENVKILY